MSGVHFNDAQTMVDIKPKEMESDTFIGCYLHFSVSFRNYSMHKKIIIIHSAFSLTDHGVNNQQSAGKMTLLQQQA